MVTSGPVVAEQVVKVDEPRRRMASMAGSPAQLENATRDLFRLAGGQSIPVEARVPAEKPKPKPAPAAARQPTPAAAREPERTPASSRKAESSVLFSLESLMKAAGGQKAPAEEEVDQQLWNMQAETPLFGTSQDHALLTTPLDPPPGSTPMDSMTVSSRRPAGVRTSLLLALGTAGAIVLAGIGWFVLSPSSTDAPTAAVALDAPQDRTAALSKEPAAAAEPQVAQGTRGAALVEPAGSDKPEDQDEPAEDKPSSDPASSEDSPSKAAADDEAGDEAGDEPATEDKPAAVASSTKPKTAVPRSTKKAPPRAAKATAPFNVGAAKNALNAAAAKAASCSGTSGKGKVQLTFAPTGKVSSAQLTEGPFAGTAAGKCALRYFKAATVPAFAGSPQTVAKSFKIP